MRQAARLAFLAGALGIGFFLFRAVPRDVTLVYAGAAPATAVEVEIARGGEIVRRTELRFPSGAPAQIEHRVRLPEGHYTLRLRLAEGGGARVVQRPFSVSEDGAVVVNVAP
jgi:hypothetical protein